MSRNAARLIGVGMTRLNPKPVPSPSRLMQQALDAALGSIPGVGLKDISGLIAIPSLAKPHFMEAHYFATQVGLLPAKHVQCRTIDTGGAGPVAALLSAQRMVAEQGLDLVAVVAGDAVKGLDSAEFLRRADATCEVDEGDVVKVENSKTMEPLPSPVIPNGYDRVAQYQMQQYGLTRSQLAAVSALMSIMASKHPYALTRTPRTVKDVLEAQLVAPVTSVLECARRADGGAALLVASTRFLERRGLDPGLGVVVVGGGEASGPLYPPSVGGITEDMFSCEEAAEQAYREAQVGVRDIDFFGLYDCFPICLIRAVEAVGLCGKGKGGLYIEHKYQEILFRLANEPNFKPQEVFPINTHGGLQAFGAPWEVPAMYNIIEAFHQLTNTAGDRQVANARRALVYGNGGIFSHSAVAILGNGRY
ncbi:hypothetical protein HDU78_001825 [Chytriomyces hyalinus]|nr:hypothetical protein HDU78_001825 [Chytriomyces hyalinus]